MFALFAVSSAACASSAARARGSGDVLRLGIFPNLTHAPGHVAIGSGILKQALGSTKLDATVFNSGTDAGNALLAGSIDATYIGTGPATSLFVKSRGGVSIVSGAVAGGASLVVRKGAGISQPSDLNGKKLAVPGIGNTQDVALRTWLASHGLKPKESGGSVAIVPVDNPELPQLFRSGQVDGAWEPEPWPSLLEQEGLAQELVDEASLWPRGQFVTTVLVVSKPYLEAHQDVGKRLVEANVKAIDLIRKDPARAQSIAASELTKAGAPQLPAAVVQAAWKRLTFTWEPLAASVQKSAQNAFALGYLDSNPTNIAEIFRLDLLNAVLRAQGEPPVQGTA
jgi:NitT/TauT family transport system substrate-binding protein